MAMRREDLPNAITRRTFLASSAGAGVVMGLGVVLPGCAREEDVTADIAADMASDGASRSFAPTVWFEIDGNGGVLINIAKAEMGQHVGTALARVIADELGADWDAVEIKHVDSDPQWGYMITGGSWSVFTTFAMLSQAGAAGRIVLRDAGAALLGADPADCTVAAGKVAANGAQVSFAEIVQRGDISRTFTEEELGALPLLPAAERRYVGRPTQARDVPAKSSGQAEYGLDVELPGMVYAHPLIPPTRYGSTIQAIDDTAAKDIAGYQQTLTLTDPAEVLQGWAVVIADDYPSAMKAAAAVGWTGRPGRPRASASGHHRRGRQAGRRQEHRRARRRRRRCGGRARRRGEHAQRDVYDEHRVALHARAGERAGRVRRRQVSRPFRQPVAIADSADARQVAGHGRDRHRHSPVLPRRRLRPAPVGRPDDPGGAGGASSSASRSSSCSSAKTTAASTACARPRCSSSMHRSTRTVS